MRNRRYSNQGKSTPKSRNAYQPRYFVVKTSAAGETKLRAPEFENEFLALGFKRSRVLPVFASMQNGEIFKADNAEYRAERY